MHSSGEYLPALSNRINLRSSAQYEREISLSSFPIIRRRSNSLAVRIDYSIVLHCLTMGMDIISISCMREEISFMIGYIHVGGGREGDMKVFVVVFHRGNIFPPSHIFRFILLSIYR